MTFYLLCKTNEVSEGELREFVLKEVEILVVKYAGQIILFAGAVYSCWSTSCGRGAKR